MNGIFTMSTKTFASMGKVRDILRNKGNSIFSIEPSETVFSALESLVRNNIGALMVVEDGKFVGIFTERDYARKVILKGKASKGTLVGDIMTQRPITVTMHTTIQECMSIMTTKFIRHLPVIEDGELVGLISIGDVVKFIIDEQTGIIEYLEHYITGHQ
jgi:CBS domain-containing protein